jgi:DNA-binding MarR family transcriptional regulator
VIDLESLDLGHLAQFVGQAYNEHVQDALRAAGFAELRDAHGYLFQHLLAVDPTIGELAERMEVTQQAVSKLVGELVTLGYVERAVDPDDARIRRIRLSARGREAVARARTARAELEARLANGETERTRTALIAVLRALGAEPRIRSRRVRPPT